MYKKCRLCERTKDSEDFYEWRNVCKDCYRARQNRKKKDLIIQTSASTQTDPLVSLETLDRVVSMMNDLSSKDLEIRELKKIVEEQRVEIETLRDIITDYEDKIQSIQQGGASVISAKPSYRTFIRGFKFLKLNF